MPFPILAAIAAAGLVSDLVQGNKANKNQKKALNLQKQLADRQTGLMDTATKPYGELVDALRQQAGFSASGYNPNQGAHEDALRLQQAQRGIGQNLHSRMGQLSFNLGRRGLGGSSFDTAGQAALLASAGRSSDDFHRQLAIDQPQRQLQRLQALGGALGPGLSGGQQAASIYGQQAQIAGNQLAGAQAGIGGTLQSYLQYEGLKSATPPPQVQYTDIAGGAGSGPAPIDPRIRAALAKYLQLGT